jgi:hypothetical protein
MGGYRRQYRRKQSGLASNVVAAAAQVRRMEGSADMASVV